MPRQKQKIAFAYKVSMTHYIYTPHYKKKKRRAQTPLPLSAIIVYHNIIFLASSTRETLSSSKPPQFQENSSPIRPILSKNIQIEGLLYGQAIGFLRGKNISHHHIIPMIQLFQFLHGHLLNNLLLLYISTSHLLQKIHHYLKLTTS